MAEWVKRWEADQKPVDLALLAHLAPHRYGAEYERYADGAQDFIRLLRALDTQPFFSLGWTMRGFRLWADEAAFLADAAAVAAGLDYADEAGSIGIIDDAETLRGIDLTHYSFHFSWDIYATQLKGEVQRFHPDRGLRLDDMIGMIDAVTRWKRPQHLEFGPLDYFFDHHPLDRARRGIQWIGWVPFGLSASDVPEAALVQEMNGGTLIVSHKEVWQVFEHHPLYSKAAIEQTQEVELRLNLLGVLPTAVELNRGDWGLGDAG